MNQKQLISLKIKDLRKEKKLTQEEFAEIVDLSKQTICNYESGRRTPNFDTLEVFTNAFGLPENYFTEITLKSFVAMRIKELRHDKNLTLDEFGALIGKSGSQVSTYESGSVSPRNNVLQEIVKSFDLNEDYFVSNENETIIDLKQEIAKLKERVKMYEKIFKMLPENLEKLWGNFSNRVAPMVRPLVANKVTHLPNFNYC